MAEVKVGTASMFGFSSTEHFFAAALHDLQKALQFAAHAGSAIAKAEGEAVAITSLVPNSNKAVTLERAAFAALGLVVNAAAAASAAAAQDGLNLKLDAAMVTAFRALIDGCRSELATLGYTV